MTKTFKNLLENLINAIDETNEEMIKNIFLTEYKFACIKQNVTYDTYYQILNSKWNTIIDKMISEKDKCMTISELYYAEEHLKNIPFNSLQTADTLMNDAKSHFTRFFDERYKEENDPLTNTMFDILTDLLATDDIYINANIMTTLMNLGNLIKTRSTCWLWDIIILCASTKIKSDFPTYNKNSLEDKKKVNLMLRSYLNEIKSMLIILNKDTTKDFFNKTLNITSNNLTQSYGMSKVNKNTNLIENELNSMIPENIGPLKCFFVDLIQYYYSSDILHPIIWAQILRDMFINFLKNPPLSEKELFQFFSKHLLLNSGPFILKILQQVRPIMSEEQRKTYNLSKLTYPKMTKSQYTLILSKIVKNWDNYKLYNDASASIGHVFFVENSITMEKFVIKVAKPLSIIQSCYEYSKLNNFFKKGTLEQNFVHNMLYSTGKELESHNEIKNINHGHKLYTMNYSELYSNINIDASLTTITAKENVIIDNCWFALGMTIAPGIPLSKLLEAQEKTNLSTDTVYRAYLHRCFDLLVFKFFNNIIKNGFYHGDLHAGNVYFSFVDEPIRKAQITLIDFGSVGTIDIFNDNPDINDLIKIMIQSVFYNFDDIFDTLTDLLNRKSINSAAIDKTSINYEKFKNKMKKIRIKNIYYSMNNKKIDENYIDSCITSNKRASQETSFQENHKPVVVKEDNIKHAKCYSLHNNLPMNLNKEEDTVKTSIDSLYDYIDMQNSIGKNSNITELIDNLEPLPSYDCKIDISNNIMSFTEVINCMQKFFTESNVNIPITIPDLYELLKAFLLLNGLASQINYEPLRMSTIIKKIVYQYSNIVTIVKHPLLALKIYNIYDVENKNYNKCLEKINTLQNLKSNI